MNYLKTLNRMLYTLRFFMIFFILLSILFIFIQPFMIILYAFVLLIIIRNIRSIKKIRDNLHLNSEEGFDEQMLDHLIKKYQNEDLSDK